MKVTMDVEEALALLSKATKASDEAKMWAEQANAHQASAWQALDEIRKEQEKFTSWLETQVNLLGGGG